MGPASGRRHRSLGLLLLLVFLLLVDESYQKKDQRRHEGLLGSLEQGLEVGLGFLKDNQRDIEEALSSMIAGAEKVARRDAGDPTGTPDGGSDPAGTPDGGGNPTSTPEHEDTIVDLLKAWTDLQHSLKTGTLDLQKVVNTGLRLFHYFRQNPETLSAMVKLLLGNLPDLGNYLSGRDISPQLQEMVVGLLKTLNLGDLSTLKLTPKTVSSIAKSLLKASLSPDAYARYELLVDPVIDVGFAIQATVAHWHDGHGGGTTDPKRRSALPDVNEVFLEILEEPIRKLTVALRSAEQVSEMLEDGRSRRATGARDVGQLARSVREAAVLAKLLNSRKYGEVEDNLALKTFEALPVYQDLIHELRDDTDMGPEARQRAQMLANDVEDSIDRLVRMKRLADNIVSWSDLVTITKDVRDVVEGIPRFQRVTTALTNLLVKLRKSK